MLKTKILRAPERYERQRIEHVLSSPDYSLKEKGAEMKRGANGRFYNPLKGEPTAEPQMGQEQAASDGGK